MAASDITESYRVHLISGNSNPKLAQDIADYLGIKLTPAEVGQFADGEINIHVKINVRGSDCFIIQPTCGPDVNRSLMELILLIQTLKLSSAKRITAVVPYYGYARQDRKTKPRVPISASAVAQLIECMGVHRVVTLDLHCGQIQGFFHNAPVDNLFAELEFVKYLRTKNYEKDSLVIVSPDAGGVERARRIADRLGGVAIATILKRRAAANQIESMEIVGAIEGKICVIVDDIIDTAGTLVKAAQLLVDKGAKSVSACATHGLFSGEALPRITGSILEEVCVTDSTPQEKNISKCAKLRVLSVVPLLANVIQRLHDELSLSDLFDEKK